MTEQQVERRRISVRGGKGQRHAVAGVGSCVEQRGREWQGTYGTDRAPEHPSMDSVVQPRKAEIGIGSERHEPSCNCDEAGLARFGAHADRCVADVVQWFPAARPAWFRCERGMRDELLFNDGCVAEEKRGVETRAGDSRMPREQ